MSLLANLFRLVGPTLTNGYCPATFQQLADDFFNGSQVTILIDTGNFLYNYGTATPAPENRIFPWYNTNFNRWYNFQTGLWVSPVNPSDLVFGFTKLWIPDPGTPESVLWSLDEGSGLDPRQFLPDGSPNPAYVAPTDTTGAMWKTVQSLIGRVPIGVGEIPGSDLGSGPASVNVVQSTDTNGNSGEYAHLLTDPEGAVGQHVHAIGQSDTSHVTGSAGFNVVGLTTTTPFFGWTVSGGASVPFTSLTQADLYTLKADNGNGIPGVKHNNMQPYLGVYFITHTPRKFYTLPP